MAEVLAADALTTAARIKTRLSITASGFDTFFLYLINSVTAYIKGECNQPTFKETTYTGATAEIHSIIESGQSQLLLKQSPVSAVTKLEYNAGTKSVTSWTEYLADEFDFDAASGIIYLDGNFPKGINNIRVTYTAGYKFDFANYISATHTLPADLTELCERLVIRIFKRRDAEGKSGETEGGNSVNWEKELNDEDKAILARYRRLILQ